jgi:hypothetical protein
MSERSTHTYWCLGRFPEVWYTLLFRYKRINNYLWEKEITHNAKKQRNQRNQDQSLLKKEQTKRRINNNIVLDI